MKMKKCKLMSVVLSTFLMFVASYVSVFADSSDTYTLKVKGTAYYDKAQKVLEYVNEERTSLGLDKLVMDEDLTKTAMLRAAEAAVDFSHTRPDGTSCFTANDRMYGENLAAGNSTAQATFEQWKNSSGHYANMINSSYKSIGIGCFSQDGVTFWCQVFSWDEAITKETTNTQKTKKYSIKILEGEYPLAFDVASYEQNRVYTIEADKTKKLTVGRVNPGWTYTYCEFMPESMEWSSSNTSIAVVDSEGVVTSVGRGTATITATPKTGDKTKVTIKVKCEGGSGNSSSGTNSQGSVDKPAKVKELTYTKVKKRVIKLTWKKVKDADGYRIKYSTNRKLKNSKIKTTTKKKIKIKNLKKGRTYYIKVRAYKVVNGDKLYGKWSKKLKVKIAK